jgi:hypothetical protein
MPGRANNNGMFVSLLLLFLFQLLLMFHSSFVFLVIVISIFVDSLFNS